MHGKQKKYSFDDKDDDKRRVQADGITALARRFLPNCPFSYAGNWELVKSIMGTKFRSSHVCLNFQAGNRP